MIYDCFPFFNELDLLEIRLNSLAPYVDKFVLAECTVTHSGKPKPLYYEQNKDRFKGFDITHLVMDVPFSTSWEIEGAQRGFLINGIRDADPDDIILVSDADEIPNLRDYKGEEGMFPHKMYYYYLNVYTGSMLRGTVAIKRSTITSEVQTGHLDNIRDIVDHRHSKTQRNNKRVLPYMSWHFSTLGNHDQIIHKIESFAHREVDTPEIKGQLAERIQNLRDPYMVSGRIYTNRHRKFSVEMPSGPQWLLDNISKYQHLVRSNGNLRA